LLQVLDIITLRKDGLRGQAWVIMEDVQASTAALQAENGASFFGRELRIEYAKEVSNILKDSGSEGATTQDR
jgi:U2 small nuclear ribonucleoprotein B''